LISAEYLDETYNTKLANGNSVIMGIEIDQFRKPVAYWLKKTNTEIEIYGTFVNGSLYRVPAEEILHLFVKTYPGQLRGISWFAPAMLMMKMLYGFEEAKLVDARVSASTTLALKYKDSAAGNEINESNVAGGEKSTTEENTIYEDVTPGKTLIIPKNMEPWMYDPKSPNGNESEFAMHYLRGISSGLLVSFISLANNYSAVNYSSGRLNLLDERETFRELQAWFREHFLDWNFQRYLKMALLTQAITLPLSKYDKFNQFWFTGRSWPWVDPEKDIKAKVIALESNLETYESVLTENGIWPEEHWEQLKKEKELFKENGWTWPSSKNQPLSSNAGDDTTSVPTNGNGKHLIKT
jgi:lambda family phage portal protein